MQKWINNGFIALYFLLTSQLLASELSIPLPRNINQDSQGFIWVGTQSHAIRYDGHKQIALAKNIGYINKIISDEQTVYIAGSKAIVAVDKQLNEHRIFTAKSDSDILSVVLHKQVLYVVTQKQLYKISSPSIKPSTTGIMTYSDISSSNIVSIADNICFVSNDKLLRCLDGTPENKLTIKLHLPEKMLTVIKHNRRVYMNSKNSVYELSSGDYRLNQLAEFKDNKLGKMSAALKSEQLWLMVNNKPVLVSSRNAKPIIHNFNREKKGRVASIFQSTDGTLWLASSKLEIIPETSVSISKIKGLDSTSGMAWLINPLGMHVLDVGGVSELFTGELENTLESEPLQHINDVAKGHIYAAAVVNSSVWYGGFHGLFRSDISMRDIENFSHLIANKTVQCIRKVTDNLIAVCVANVGVYLINQDTQQTTLAFSDDSISSIVDVLTIDGDINNSWLATDSGVYRYENNKLTHYLPNSHAIRLTSIGNQLFVATLDDGLFSIEPHGSAVTISNIVLPGLGDRINDIAIVNDVLSITTGIGIATYHVKTKKVSTWPLGKSVGRIRPYSDNKAITADGELVAWPNTIESKLFSGKIILSSFMVNGEQQPLSKVVADGSYVEFSISTSNYNNVSHHLFKIKINDNPWSAFSDTNHVAFLPKSGENIVKIKALVSGVIEHEFSFKTEVPWFASTLAKVVYCLLMLSAVAFSLKLFVNNRRNFIALANDYSEKVELLKTENGAKQLDWMAANLSTEKMYRSRLRNIVEVLNKEQDDFISRLKIKEDKKIELDYSPLFDKLAKVQALLQISQVEEANKVLLDIEQHVHVSLSMMAPSVLLDNDLVATVQRLIASLQYKKLFYNINLEHVGVVSCDDIHAKQAYSAVYKSIYELLTHLTDHTDAIAVELSIENTDDLLTVECLVKDYQFKKQEFSKSNLGLYQAKVLVQHFKGEFTISPSDEKGSVILMTVPLSTQTNDTPKALTM